MTKITLFFFFVSFAATAQFNQGTVTFNNGSTKSGLIEIPKFQDSKVRFKTDQKAKVEKFSVDDVKQFEITNPQNEKETYVTMRLGNNKTFNVSEIRVDDEKNFVRVLNKKRIGIYVAHFEGNSVSGGGGTMRSHSYGGDRYYLQREGDDFAFSIGTHRYDLDFMTGMSTYGVINENFKDICPEFWNKLMALDLPVSRFAEFADVYEETCPKK
ncbi:MAG TPA: hypothetical protein VFQ50_05650 [Flavobacterium sp.]|nr:hypothetical protein [Flavobacterium sp.]